MWYRRQAGFTLLELLLVCTLLTSVATVVVLSMPDGAQTSLKRAVASLTVQIDKLSDDALIQGRPYAMEFDGETYRVFQLNTDEQWTPRSQHRLLAGVTVSLAQIEGAPLNRANEKAMIYFWADGTLTPFEGHFRTASSYYRFRVDALGHVESIEDTP